MCGLGWIVFPLHLDPHFIEFLAYSFPLGMTGELVSRKDIKNHHLADAFLKAIRKYLQKKTAVGAMISLSRTCQHKMSCISINEKAK